jgi:XTP/dITP diphosphohydrolase
MEGHIEISAIWGVVCKKMMPEILFSSSNKSKIKQFQFVADSLGIKVRVVSVYEKYPDIKPYDEEYKTQYEIVDKGAHEIYEQIRQPIFVEDSTLEVDALGGRPGLYSSDYLKTKGRGGLLAELHGQSMRTARTTSMVGYFDGRLFISSKNVVEGRIATEESYKEGEPDWVGPTHHPFGGGFNSVFITNASNKTIADHSAKEGLIYGYREPNFKFCLELHLILAPQLRVGVIRSAP